MLGRQYLALPDDLGARLLQTPLGNLGRALPDLGHLPGDLLRAGAVRQLQCLCQRPSGVQRCPRDLVCEILETGRCAANELRDVDGFLLLPGQPQQHPHVAGQVLESGTTLRQHFHCHFHQHDAPLPRWQAEPLEDRSLHARRRGPQRHDMFHVIASGFTRELPHLGLEARDRVGIAQRRQEGENLSLQRSPVLNRMPLQVAADSLGHATAH
mmetsp:Transcript_41689/g.107937  ORF Transcript_41689/g.107937 Transcript_41689/m.107937 type:complete len:212 (+) Transcript_41689:863-1498(+)